MIPASKATATPMATPEQVKGANALFDQVKEKLGLRTDAQLSQLLDVAPPVVSKIRHGFLMVGDTLLIALDEETDLTVKEMKQTLCIAPKGRADYLK
jgi:hypothetical protein